MAKIIELNQIYRKTDPISCGNLKCKAILEPPFHTTEITLNGIGKWEGYFCQNCKDLVNNSVGEKFSIHVV